VKADYSPGLSLATRSAKLCADCPEPQIIRRMSVNPHTGGARTAGMKRLRAPPSMLNALCHKRFDMRRIYTIIVLATLLFCLACGKSGTSAANLSSDDKHKLYQAAMNTRDVKLLQQVMQAIGFADANGSPTPAFDPFFKEHKDWASKNFDFVKEHFAPDKAKEYVNDHLPK
jgi:hypothetical protein